MKHRKLRFMAAAFLTAAFSISAVFSASAAGWQQDEAGWWWQNEDGTWPARTWKWIDADNDGFAECYYFGADGYMLYSAVTPDGYYVNEDGAWVMDGVVQKGIRIDDSVSGSGSGSGSASEQNEGYAGSKTNISEEEARARILALKSFYPEGMSWDNSNSYDTGYRAGFGCAAFAFIVQDEVFGAGVVPERYTVFNEDNIHIGDHFRIYASTGGVHSVVILDVADDGVELVEGNYGGKIHWGRKMSFDSLRDNFIFQETRY